MKVIVIGAGVAGLTLGLACQRAGIDVKIYEKTNELRNIGGGILVWPHGMRYLQWLGLSHCTEPYLSSIKKCNIIGYTNEQIFSEDFTHFSMLVGGEPLPIERHLFQQALLKELSPDCLTLGKRCVAVSEDATMARVIFADGSEDQADLIVGADGIHSVVRQCINPTIQPEYTGICWWGGVVDSQFIPHFPAEQSYVALGQGKAFFAWPAFDDKFIWYLPVRMPAEDLISTENGLLQLQSICADWNNVDVKQIVANSIENNRFHLAVNTLPAPTQWSTKRITLIGDAVHATGPILAQGASLAIEDAFILASCLQKNTQAMPHILKHYESLRKDKYARIVELENQSVDMMVTNSLDTLEVLQQQMKYLDLATMYKELIPLVDENACLELAAATKIMDDVVLA
jgi:2-polyprenyl-6-methoxyphenol hydroxylase-like FAD-dependent oxidoreductase